MIFTRLLKKPSPDALEPVLRNYGDLLFDLCESVLSSPQDAQHAFRAILKKIGRKTAATAYVDQERAWCLRIACEELHVLSRRNPRKMSATEQLELDSSINIAHKLKRFDGYFQRLPVEDRLLLLLREKYGIPFPEISTAMGTPEGSLKIRRQHALRTLEEWIWSAQK